MAWFLLVEATLLFITDVSSVKMIAMVTDTASVTNRREVTKVFSLCAMPALLLRKPDLLHFLYCSDYLVF